MTPEETKALIEETRARAALLREFTPGEYDVEFEEAWSDSAEVLDRLADALSALSSHPDEETEWEVGRVSETAWRDSAGEFGVSMLSDTEGNQAYQRSLGYLIVERRPAGPWRPVPADREGA